MSTPDIMRFVSPRTVNTLRLAGMHKVAGAMLGLDELNIKEAAREIGRRAFLRRADAKKIASGIEALAELNGEKIASVLPALLSRQAGPALLGAGAAVLPDLLSHEGPLDNDALMRKALMGGALGMGAGALHTGHKALQANPHLEHGMADAIAKMPR